MAATDGGSPGRTWRKNGYEEEEEPPEQGQSEGAGGAAAATAGLVAIAGAAEAAAAGAAAGTQVLGEQVREMQGELSRITEQLLSQREHLVGTMNAVQDAVTNMRTLQGTVEGLGGEGAATRAGGR